MADPTPDWPVVRELTPCPDPWAVARKLADQPGLLFLDSAGGPPHLARYSFVAADPYKWLEWRGSPDRLDDPFRLVAELLAAHPTPTVPGLPPFQGGAAGLWSYDLCHAVERLPRPRFDEFGVPPLCLAFYDWVVAWDHAACRAWVVSTGVPHADRADAARRRLRDVLALLNRPDPPPRSRPSATVGLSAAWPLAGRVVSPFDRGGFEAVVARGVDYVRAGDCFQVNLAQRLAAPLSEHPLSLYGRLRECNPAPFAGYFDMGDFALASASPERFVEVRGREVVTRPIKGTRPRGATPSEDRQHLADLLASAKDRAENVMIVDLMRNDLGRVCEFGTVRVPGVCVPESYRDVHHLVSEVRGRLRPGLGVADLLRASFPGGSVTGAPKVRAMEIIAELEPTTRGAYCGCLGYLGFDGSADLNILIRTFTLGRGWATFPVGGGVVADSVPAREYDETLHKAAGLLRALG